MYPKILFLFPFPLHTSVMAAPVFLFNDLAASVALECSFKNIPCLSYCSTGFLDLEGLFFNALLCFCLVSSDRFIPVNASLLFHLHSSLYISCPFLFSDISFFVLSDGVHPFLDFDILSLPSLV